MQCAYGKADLGLRSMLALPAMGAAPRHSQNSLPRALSQRLDRFTQERCQGNATRRRGHLGVNPGLLYCLRDRLLGRREQST